MIILFYAHTTDGIPPIDLDDLQREIDKRDAEKWRRLTKYLQNDYIADKPDHRVAMQSDNTFIVHPIDIDGDTLDFKING